MKEQIVPQEAGDKGPKKAWSELKKLGAFAHGKEEEFAEVYEMMDEEFKEAGVEQRKDLLTQRYFSGRAGDYQLKLDSQGVYFGRSELKRERVQAGNVNKTMSGDEGESFDDRVEIMQYGSSRVFDVQPGGWVIARLEEQDIVGSSLFSCCSGVVARSGDTVGFAHIRMGDHASTKFMAEFFQKQLKHARIDLFLAESDTGDPKKDANINDWNKKMIDELKEEGIEVHVHYYPYIVAGMKNNPHKQNSASLLAGLDMLRSIGVKEKHQKKGRKTETILQQMEETIEDMER